MECKGAMIIKFLKSHPTLVGWSDKKGIGKYNKKSTIKAMNLIINGHASLVHSCKECNPYHLDITLDDFSKPFKVKNKGKENDK